MFTHIIECSSPELLPFARSRIKALRATGLKYSAGRYDVNGVMVSVRIEGPHDFIQIGGTGYLWVLLNYTTGYIYEVADSVQTPTSGKTITRSKLFRVSLGQNNNSSASLFYDGSSTLTGPPGHQQIDSSTYGSDSAPALRDFHVNKNNILGVSWDRIGQSGSRVDYTTYFYSGIGKGSDGNFGYSNKSSIKGPGGTLLAINSHFGLEGFDLDPLFHNQRPSTINGELYYTVLDVDPQTYARYKISIGGAVIAPAADWAPIFGAEGVVDVPVLTGSDTYSLMDTGWLVQGKDYFTTFNSGFWIADKISYDRKGNSLGTFPGSGKPLNKTTYLTALLNSGKVWQWHVGDIVTGFKQKCFDLRNFPTIADDADFLNALNLTYGSTNGPTPWIDQQDCFSTIAMSGRCVYTTNDNALQIIVRTDSDVFPPITVSNPEA